MPGADVCTHLFNSMWFWVIGAYFAPCWIGIIFRQSQVARAIAGLFSWFHRCIAFLLWLCQLLLAPACGMLWDYVQQRRLDKRRDDEMLWAREECGIRRDPCVGLPWSLKPCKSTRKVLPAKGTSSPTSYFWEVPKGSLQVGDGSILFFHHYSLQVVFGDMLLMNLEIAHSQHDAQSLIDLPFLLYEFVQFPSPNNVALNFVECCVKFLPIPHFLTNQFIGWF